MSLSADAKSQLRQQLGALSDAAITAEQLGQLHTLVKTSTEACQLYVEHLLLDALLNWSLDKETSVSLPLDSTASSSVVASAWPIKVGGSNRWLRFPLSARFAAIAASLLLISYFAALTGLLLWDRLSPRFSRHELVQHENEKGASVAKLIRADGCRWDLDRSATIDQWFTAGPLHLRTGVAELQFADGAQVAFEGPAEFELRSPKEAFLGRGKLVATVPHQAIGFTVETPTAKVVDLGTEFGVEVNSVGETSVQVLEGIVEFSSNPKRVEAGRTQPVTRLRKGEAARTDLAASGIVATEFKPDKLSRRLSRELAASRRKRMVDLAKITATQSSEFEYQPYPAGQAIDGDPKTISHTDVNDSASWWQLDLGSARPIGIVGIYNDPSRRGWLRDITVKILAADGKTVVASSQKLNPKNVLGGGELDFDQGPTQLVFDVARGESIVGRFVRIEREACAIDEASMKTARRDSIWLSGCRGTLVLGEVKVFEPPTSTKPVSPILDRQ